jgi:hypothetical protein
MENPKGQKLFSYPHDIRKAQEAHRMIEQVATWKFDQVFH